MLLKNFFSLFYFDTSDFVMMKYLVRQVVLDVILVSATGSVKIPINLLVFIIIVMNLNICCISMTNF